MLKTSLSSNEIATRNTEENTVEFRSRFEFLKMHSGIRPGRSHGLGSTTGAGKSSLLKAIIADCAIDHKVMVWLSEEEVKDYQMGLAKYCYHPDILKNITWVEERNLPDSLFKSQEAYFNYFEEQVLDCNPDVVFVDNVTTSFFYADQLGSSGQSRSARFLTKFPSRVGPALFYMAHLDTKCRDNDMRIHTPEDTRGNRSLPNQTEYFYVLQKYTSDERQDNIVRVAKYRHHEDARGYYILHYDKGEYLKDTKVHFNDINEIFKGRDRLGMK